MVDSDLKIQLHQRYTTRQQPMLVSACYDWTY